MKNLALKKTSVLDKASAFETVDLGSKGGVLEEHFEVLGLGLEAYKS